MRKWLARYVGGGLDWSRTPTYRIRLIAGWDAAAHGEFRGVNSTRSADFRCGIVFRLGGAVGAEKPQGPEKGTSGALSYKRVRWRARQVELFPHLGDSVD